MMAESAKLKNNCFKLFHVVYLQSPKNKINLNKINKNKGK